METNSSNPRLLHDLHSDFLSEGARRLRRDVLEHSNSGINDKEGEISGCDRSIRGNRIDPA